MTSSRRTLLGIDPGVKGSMALLGGRGNGLCVKRLPVLIREGSSRAFKQIDAAKLYGMLVELGPIDECVLEDVRSVPGDGHVGAFSFGHTKGIIEGVLGSVGIRIRYVAPSVWKGKMGLTRDKKLSRALAERAFPSVKFGSYDDCEAALLALYGVLYVP